MRVLLAEDNPRLGGLIREGLQAEGFAVDWLDRLGDAEAALREVEYDLVVLDLGMPDGDGVDLVRSLRRAGAGVPVLVVTARDGLGDRVTGLDAGADDYLVKPFAMPELAARCRAQLRRPGGRSGAVLAAGNLTLDTVAREVRVDGARAPLSPRERSVLEHLLRRAGEVVPKASLEQALYAFDREATPNAVEVAVSRLRKRLARSGATPVVHTVHGIGYTLVA